MEAPAHDQTQRSETVFLPALVCAVWFGAALVLPRYAALWLPRALASQLSLELYLSLIQLVVLGIGLSAAGLLLKGNARGTLGITAPQKRAVILALLVAPALFVAASYLSVYLARPTLLEEIRRGGSALVRKNAGDVGRVMREAPLLVTLCWSVIVAPVTEELLFRGALWGALQRLVERVTARPEDPRANELPSEFMRPSLVLRVWAASAGWFKTGGLATLVSAAIFGFMHFDMPGGQGIIRVTAATCLGLACGVSRQHSGTVLLPMLIHLVFNLLGLGGARRWLVSEAFPTHYMVPTLTSLGSALLLLLALLWFLVTRARRA